jgi:myosin III
MDYYRMCQRFGLNSVPSPDGRFTIDELIGEGTYGEVFRAKDTTSGKRLPKLINNIGIWPYG